VQRALPNCVRGARKPNQNRSLSLHERSSGRAGSQIPRRHQGFEQLGLFKHLRRLRPIHARRIRPVRQRRARVAFRDAGSPVERPRPRVPQRRHVRAAVGTIRPSDEGNHGFMDVPEEVEQAGQTRARTNHLRIKGRYTRYFRTPHRTSHLAPRTPHRTSHCTTHLAPHFAHRTSHLALSVAVRAPGEGAGSRLRSRGLSRGQSRRERRVDPAASRKTGCRE